MPLQNPTVNTVSQKPDVNLNQKIPLVYHFPQAVPLVDLLCDATTIESDFFLDALIQTEKKYNEGIVRYAQSFFATHVINRNAIFKDLTNTLNQGYFDPIKRLKLLRSFIDIKNSDWTKNSAHTYFYEILFQELHYSVFKEEPGEPTKNHSDILKAFNDAVIRAINIKINKLKANPKENSKVNESLKKDQKTNILYNQFSLAAVEQNENFIVCSSLQQAEKIEKQKQGKFVFCVAKIEFTTTKKEKKEKWQLLWRDSYQTFHPIPISDELSKLLSIDPTLINKALLPAITKAVQEAFKNYLNAVRLIEVVTVQNKADELHSIFVLNLLDLGRFISENYENSNSTSPPESKKEKSHTEEITERVSTLEIEKKVVQNKKSDEKIIHNFFKLTWYNSKGEPVEIPLDNFIGLKAWLQNQNLKDLTALTNASTPDSQALLLQLKAYLMMVPPPKAPGLQADTDHLNNLEEIFIQQYGVPLVLTDNLLKIGASKKPGTYFLVNDNEKWTLYQRTVGKTYQFINTQNWREFNEILTAHPFFTSNDWQGDPEFKKNSTIKKDLSNKIREYTKIQLATVPLLTNESNSSDASIEKGGPEARTERVKLPSEKLKGKPDVQKLDKNKYAPVMFKLQKGEFNPPPTTRPNL